MNQQQIAVWQLRDEITRAIEDSYAVAGALRRVRESGLRLGIYLRIAPLEDGTPGAFLSPSDEEFLRSMRISASSESDPHLDAGSAITGRHNGIWSRLRAAFTARRRDQIAVWQLRDEITRAIEDSYAVAGALRRVRESGLRLGIYLRIAPLEDGTPGAFLSPSDEEFLRSMRISASSESDPHLDAGSAITGRHNGIWSRLRAAFTAEDRT